MATDPKKVTTLDVEIMAGLQHALTEGVKHAVTVADDNSDMTMGDRIKARRKERKLSVVKLAKAAKVSKSAIYQIEGNETKTLKGSTVILIAEALHTYEKWIETGHGPKDRGTLVPLEPDEAALLLAFNKLDAETRKSLYKVVLQLAAAEKKENKNE